MSGTRPVGNTMDPKLPSDVELCRLLTELDWSPVEVDDARFLVDCSTTVRNSEAAVTTDKPARRARTKVA